MTERRKWKAEEKLAIIKDVKENGKDSESLKSYKTILSPIRGPIQEFENFNKMEIKLCKSLSGNEKKVCKTLDIF